MGLARSIEMKAGKNDIVLLPDGSEGTILERLVTDNITVYKIRIGEEVKYFDEYKVTIKKRHLFNAVRNFFTR